MRLAFLSVIFEPNTFCRDLKKLTARKMSACEERHICQKDKNKNERTEQSLHSRHSINHL